VISDAWPGLEEFFVPGRELIVARTSADTVAALELDDAEVARIAAAARERVLADHTSDRRAEELERLLERSDEPDDEAELSEPEPQA
jgi:spore maturation protein CgeB